MAVGFFYNYNQPHRFGEIQLPGFDRECEVESVQAAADKNERNFA